MYELYWTPERWYLQLCLSTSWTWNPARCCHCHFHFDYRHQLTKTILLS